ncbi:MAG: hypothetical protein LQ350_006896 [Teloschistes chrysophthalmus]|nr:MAG: hypothetical protein LQ350_006896 [Niorma chrysophthalma]
MPSSEALTDEYLARLLAKDAHDHRFTSHGLQVGLPKRPISNAPKPNTRFLKNIIKETDNHNAALKAKEVADARVRLRGIDRHEARSEKNGRDDFRPERSDPRSHKRRKLSGDGNIVHKGEPAKQSRRDLEDKKLDKSRGNPYDDEDSTASDVRHVHRHRHHRQHHHRRPRTQSSSPDSDRRRRRRSRRRHRSRSISPEYHRDRRKKTSTRRHESRSRSPRRSHHHSNRRYHQSRPSSRSRSPSPQRSRRSDLPNGNHRPAHSTSTSPSSDSDSDSDPLASLVGPLPPPPKPLTRGRGAHTSITSNIDTHFNSTYDPSTDITPNIPAESDDWDNALEALRDRARWKASGAERLREAGFSDEAVRKWERGGEGKEEEVAWKGRGEGREWDRGKVVGPDGVQTGAEWGRLKGT